MLGISFTEFILIAVVALLVLGPEKLPTLLKAVGRAMREFRRASRELRDQLDVEGTLREAMGEAPLRPPLAPRKSQESPHVHSPYGGGDDEVADQDSPYPAEASFAAGASTEVRGPAGAIARSSPPSAPGATIGAVRSVAAPVPVAPASTVLPSRPPLARSPAPAAAFSTKAASSTDDLDAGWSEDGGNGGLELSLAPHVRPSAPPPPPAPAAEAGSQEPPEGRGRRGRRRKKGGAPATSSDTTLALEGGKKNRRRRR